MGKFFSPEFSCNHMVIQHRGSPKITTGTYYIISVQKNLILQFHLSLFSGNLSTMPVRNYLMEILVLLL
jgi:hypothetical protein